MEKSRSEAGAALRPSLKMLTLQFADGEEIKHNKVSLDNPNDIIFTLTFAEAPDSERFEMTVSIMKKEPEHTAGSGSFGLPATALTATEVVSLRPNPPRVTMSVGHARGRPARLGPPWHGGPGPYHASVVLTPLDGELHGESAGASYAFHGVSSRE